MAHAEYRSWCATAMGSRLSARTEARGRVVLSARNNKGSVTLEKPSGCISGSGCSKVVSRAARIVLI